MWNQLVEHVESIGRKERMTEQKGKDWHDMHINSDVVDNSQYPTIGTTCHLISSLLIFSFMSSPLVSSRLVSSHLPSLFAAQLYWERQHHTLQRCLLHDLKRSLRVTNKQCAAISDTTALRNVKDHCTAWRYEKYFRATLALLSHTSLNCRSTLSTSSAVHHHNTHHITPQSAHYSYSLSHVLPTDVNVQRNAPSDFICSHRIGIHLISKPFLQFNSWKSII